MRSPVSVTMQDSLDPTRTRVVCGGRQVPRAEPGVEILQVVERGIGRADRITSLIHVVVDAEAEIDRSGTHELPEPDGRDVRLRDRRQS